MQVDSLFTAERFEQTASQAEVTKRSLPRHMTTDKAQNALESLTSRIHTFALEIIETLKELPPGVNADSHIQPQVNEITRLIEKHFSDIDKGREPYTVYKDRIHAFNLLEPLYKKLISSPSSHQTTWKEQALLIEQTLLHEDYHEAYIEHLHAIAKLTQSDAFLSIPNLYICHAWPTLENHQEAWIPPFLQRFASDLESAGMVVFINSQDFYSTSHRDKILTVDHVPIIGSPSLIARSQNDVQILGELELIKQRIQKILNGGSSWQSPALPLLVCGTREKAFPPEIASLQHMDFASNEDQSEAHSSYLSSLKKLMEHIYAVPQDKDNQARKDWEALWNGFFEKVPNCQLGLTQDVVEKYVKESPLLLEKAQLAQENPQPVTLAQQQAVKAQSVPLQTAIINGLVSYYQSNNTIPNILGKPLAIDQHYTELVIVKGEEQKKKDFEQEEKKNKFNDNRLNSWEDIHRPKEPIKLEELFNKRDDEEKEPKRILLTGRAGIGKSTLCQYIAYQWANEKLWKDRYDAIFWVPLRNLMLRQNENLYEALVHCCFPLVQKRKLSPDSLESFINESQEKVLFVLDGYDEISASLRPGSPFYDLVQELLEQKNWVLTSRPYAVHNMLSSHQVTVDRKIENVGFTNEGIEAFSQKYFSQELNTQFLEQLKQNPSVFGSAHVPLNLGLICSVWENQQAKKESPFTHLTMTSLYDELANTLLHRSLKKLDIDDSEWHEEDFDKHPLYASAIQFLEELAWEGLQQESIILSFQNQRLKELYLKHCPEQKKRSEWKRIFLQLGFLTSNGQSAALMDNEYYFIHLTFQEFFAAKHIKRLMQSDPGKAKELITDHKFIPRYQIVWWFLAGLLKNDEALLNHFFWLIDHPKDLVGLYRIGLLIRCLEECECSELLHTKEKLLDDIREWTKLVADTFNAKFKDEHNLLKNLINLLQISPEVCDLTYIPLLSKIINIDEEPKDLFWKLASEFAAQRATEALVNVGKNYPSKVIPHLVRALQSDCDKLREVIVTELGEIGQNDPAATLPVFIEALEDQVVDVRRAAVTSIGKVRLHSSEKVLSSLIKALSDSDADVRTDAVKSLRTTYQNNPQKIFPSLFKAANDEDKWVQLEAVEALEELGHHEPEKVIPVLLKTIKSENDRLRKASVKALVKTGKNHPQEVLTTFIKAVDDDAYGVRLAAVDALLEIGSSDLERTLPVLLKAVNEHKDNVVRNWSAEALGVLGQHNPNKVLPHLFKAQKSKDNETRGYIAQALMKIGEHHPKKVQSALLKALDDEDSNVQCVAINALWRHGYRDLEKELSVLVETVKDEDYGIRTFSAQALGVIAKKNLEKVLHILLKMAKDKNKYVRKAAVEELCKVVLNDQEKVFTTILEAVEDKDFDIQFIAIEALHKIGWADLEKTFPILLKALKSQQSIIRKSAAEIIKQITLDNLEKAFPRLLEAVSSENNSFRYTVTEILISISMHNLEKLFPALLKTMKEGNENARRAIIVVMQELGRKNPKKVLSHILQALDDEDYNVQRTSIRALEKIGVNCPEEVIPPLSKVFNNESLQETTVDALSNIGKNNPKKVLPHIVNHNMLAVRCLKNNSAAFLKSKNSLAITEKGLHLLQATHIKLKAAAITNQCYEILFPEKSAQTHFQKAQALEQEESYEQALNHYQEAANLAHPEALYKLAQWYKEGLHVRQSFAQARQYLQDAEALNHPNAKTALRQFNNPELLTQSVLPSPRKERLLYRIRNHPRLSLFSEPLHLQSLCHLYQSSTSPTYTQCLSHLLDATLNAVNLPAGGLDTWKADVLPQVEEDAWNQLVDHKEALDEPVDSILAKTGWVSDSMQFTFLPMQEYLAARSLWKRLQTDTSEAVKLIKQHSLNPRLSHVWPILAGLSQDPIVLRSLPKDLFQGYATPLHVFCLEEYNGLKFAKEHLKEIRQAAKSAISTKGLTWQSRELIQAIVVCPKVMEATSVSSWAFPIKKESIVPLSAAYIAHDCSSLDPLLKDLKDKKRQRFACMVIVQSEAFSTELIQPVLELLSSSQKKVRQSADQALTALARSAPKEIAPHLQNLFSEEATRKFATNAYKAMGDQIPEECLTFLKEQLNDPECGSLAIEILQKVDDEAVKDGLQPSVEAKETDSSVLDVEDLSLQLDDTNASVRQSALQQLNQYEPTEWNIPQLLQCLNDRNDHVRAAAATLLSQVNLTAHTFSWSILSDESKQAFQNTSLGLLSLLSTLNDEEQLKALIYLLAQDVQLIHENGELHFFNPIQNAPKRVTVSDQLIAQLKDNQSFLLSIPKSLFEWMRAKERNQEDWSYAAITSGIEISTSRELSNQEEVLTRLQTLEKSIKDWLGKDVSISLSNTTLQITTKNPAKLKKALEFFGIIEKSETVSESFSSDSISPESSDEEGSDE